MRFRALAVACACFSAALWVPDSAIATRDAGTKDSDRFEWVGAWIAAPTDVGDSYANQTLRLSVTPLRGGDRARVRLSNRFGAQPITFGAVTLAKQASGAQLVPGSITRVHFDGRSSVTLAPGEEAISEPVRISFEALEHLSISVYMPDDTGPATRHAAAAQASFATAAGTGDHTSDETGEAFELLLEGDARVLSRPFVTGVDVLGPSGSGVVMTIGDSITDGFVHLLGDPAIGTDAATRYPDYLARRLDRRQDRLSVVNAGIGGNRLLSDGAFPMFGPSLLRRLDADVLARSDVTDVLVLIGINDLGGSPELTADEVIGGLEELVRRLHEPRGACPHGLNVLVGTLLPSGGASSGYGEVGPRRQEVNEFIRTSGVGDGVVDFDRALRDPAQPDRLLPRYDSGDHLHPSAAGYKRMAHAVDLSMLRGDRCDVVSDARAA